MRLRIKKTNHSWPSIKHQQKIRRLQKRKYKFVIDINIVHIQKANKFVINTILQCDKNCTIGEKKRECGFTYCSRTRTIDNKKLRLCTGCCVIGYCSKLHQKLDWNYIHRNICAGRPRKEGEVL